MSISENKIGFYVGEHWVEVQGKTRMIYPLWCVSVDGIVQDSKKKVGKFSLNAMAGTQQIVVDIRQSWFGDVVLSVTVEGKPIQVLNGFLL
ncbi:MAG: hypothetical protein Q4C79_08980 [Neisseria sp.]|uniref:hypothetical protein n=1 Tax=Neisseria sp. TaxID=192066 RepID=UPI0026DB90D1|nr:hypothetical protein [Neisseria sp.]MDO4249071.1 hypothetical protein [Neisseria sp.]